MNLMSWQKELFEFIVMNKNNPIIRERKILWIEDSLGCTGKSKLSEDRWLRLHINSNFSIEFRKDNGDGTITPLSLDRLNRKIV